MQIVIFTLGNEKFALDTKLVHGIEKMMSITKVPNAPYYVKGLINLRGSIITVVDLKTLLNKQNKDQEENIIIVEINQEKIGLIVNKVDEVIEIENDKIEKPVENNSYIKGIINLKEYIVTLLEGEALIEG
ncbi:MULTISPECIES: chemotaxis protein CheW [Caloramator]|jgi:purine-binding chemotaxis protein CheW|uniref:Positive regulator of CheA protein activity (CheW) n=1 Tax=Caloramator australicus RC3 TaxID=857293 RepID=I7K8B0_9CLOT|nr:MULTISPECIES: chemotaxis protein CheW [Caloramator]MDO6355374.1 chemotaxis protein CheW [Caloramator sp. CAR-1]WDU83939.1 chemotaxis protein CheW [Caloramator sp. Dgby_cultured_2]CCJ33780.1 Positive regulator of CheA protein activity (CheW) [Caloramator australicus RC3]